MVRGTVKVLNREIVVTCGRDRFSTIRFHLTEPLGVRQIVKGNHFTTRTLFGVAWGWQDRPDGMEAEYMAELEKYAAALPAAFSARTALPDISWMRKYIPTETELEGVRELQKIHEQIAA